MKKLYDLLVLGGGSGGLSAAYSASKYNKSIGIIEESLFGGTCVNLGCIPKKIMWNASSFLEDSRQMESYGFTTKLDHSYSTLKSNRDSFVNRINQSYIKSLSQEKIDLIHGKGSFTSPTQIQVGSSIYSAKNILIATGSQPIIPSIPGNQFIKTSDDFFKLKALPETALIIGGGYIGVELAGIFNSFSVKTCLSIRGQALLKNFDEEISAFITNHYSNSGIEILKSSNLASIKKLDNGKLLAVFENDTKEFDMIFSAIGRSANLNFSGDKIGLRISNGAVWTNENNESNVEHVFAIGDVTEYPKLTPVASMAGKKLADRLFAGSLDIMSYDNIPSVVFSHPPIASVGLTEAQARDKFARVKIFKSSFDSMFYGLGNSPVGTFIKVVCVGEDLRIVGLHAVGRSVDEAIQGFAVAVRMGAKKKDFDETFAIHPTVSEEFLSVM